MSSLFSLEPDEDVAIDDEDTAREEDKPSRDNADGAVDGELARLQTDVVLTDTVLAAFASDDC